MTTKPDPTTPVVLLTAWDLKSVETKRSNQYGSGVWVERPAMAGCTALATKRLCEASMNMPDITEKPKQCLVVLAPDGRALYLIPGVKHEQALDIKYIDGRAQINLIQVFTLLKKPVQAGVREFYPVEWPDHLVSVEGNEYSALIMSLQKTNTKRLKSKRATKSLSPTQQTAPLEQFS